MRFNAEQSTSVNQGWLNQSGISIGRFQVSTSGFLITAAPPEPESSSKVSEIVRTRLRTKQHSLVSVVTEDDDEDFVPISFLEEGIKHSTSVCRIARYFSHASFVDFVKDLEAAIEDSNLTHHNFDTADKVIEVFSIPQQIAKEIFNESARKRIDTKAQTPLKVLQEITENQLGKILPIPIGSGFLVGGSHLLTNHHVIPNEETAAQCVAQFGFVEDLRGESRDSVDYEFDSTLFVSNPKLDYTLVQLKSGQFTRQAGFEFGWIQLVENDENVAPGLVCVKFEGSHEQVQSAIKSGESAIAALRDRKYEIIDLEDSLIIWHPDSLNTQVYEQDEIKELGRLMGEEAFNEPSKLVSANRSFKQVPGDAVIVVQHPKGRQKQIVLNNNEVITNGLYRDFLRYETDADYGSSGSPAFNIRWELVALHHAAVPKKAENPAQQVSDWLGIECHQGVRTCRIVADLKQQSVTNPKLKSFIEDFVITAEQSNNPPFPAALEFDGQQSYVVLDSNVAAASDVWDEQQQKRIIKLWSKDFIELKSFEEDSYSRTMCFSPDGQLLAIAISRGNQADNLQINVWNVGTGQLCKALNVSGEFEALSTNLSFSSDNKTLVYGNIYGAVKIWNLESNQPQTFEQTASTDFVSVSPDGKVVASVGSGDTTIRLLNIETGESTNLSGHTDTIFSIDYSFDGKTLASGGMDGTIRLWNPETREIKDCRQYQQPINSVKFSPDGKVLAFADSDGLKLWHLETDRLTTIQALVWSSPDFSPDGQQIAAVVRIKDDSSTTTVKIWNLDGTLNTILPGEAGSFFIFNPRASQSTHEPIQRSNNFSQLTIEAWVNPFRGGALVTQGANPSDAESTAFTFGVNLAGQVYFTWAAVSGNSVSEYATHHPALSTNLKGRLGLSHIAVTWDGEEYKCYIDGQYDNNFFYGPTSRPIDGIGVGSFSLLSSPILIGAILKQGTPERAENSSQARVPVLDELFSGIIAEIRLWNIARTPVEIEKNMNRQLKGDELGLIGCWKFEEREGDKIYNLAPDQEDVGLLHAVKRLNATQLYFSSLPYGLRFVRSTDRVHCQMDAILRDAITVEAWIKHKFGNCLIVSQGNVNGCYFSMELQNGKLQVTLQSKNDTLQSENDIEKTIVETEHNFSQRQSCHHVAFTWEGDAHEISLYIDGRLQNSVVIDGRSKTIIAPSKQQTYGLFTGSLERIATDLRIGGQKDLQKTDLKKQNSAYDVVISDVRIWQVCRPQDEIKANMARRLNSTLEKKNGLIGYWRLDKGADDRVINLVSKAPAVVEGATWFPAPPAQPSESAANPPES